MPSIQLTLNVEVLVEKWDGFDYEDGKQRYVVTHVDMSEVPSVDELITSEDYFELEEHDA